MTVIQKAGGRIQISRKSCDWAFVRDAIKNQGLNPCPMMGFHERDHYWSEDANHLRVIEDYDWGNVIVVESRGKKTKGATLVCQGKFVHQSGVLECFRPGEESKPIHIKTLVAWYEEGIIKAKKERRENGVVLPCCFGNHEAGPICDGGLNRNTHQCEVACRWRKMCKGLMNYCDEQNTVPEQVISQQPAHEVIALCKGLSEPDDNTYLGDPVALTGTRNQGAEKKSLPDDRSKGRTIVSDLLNAFWKGATEAGFTGRTLFQLKSDKLPKRVRTGDVIVIDRTRTKSRYYSAFCQPPGGTIGSCSRIPIATIKPRPMKKEIQVELPVSLEDEVLLSDLVVFIKPGRSRMRVCVREIASVEQAKKLGKVVYQTVLVHAWAEIERRELWTKENKRPRGRPRKDATA
jgi:hypothetical protein